MLLFKKDKEVKIEYNDSFFIFRGVLFKKTTDGNFVGAHKASIKETLIYNKKL